MEVESETSRRREKMTISSIARDSDSAFIKAKGSGYILISRSCNVVSDGWDDCCFIDSVDGCRGASGIPYEVGEAEREGVISCEGVSSTRPPLPPFIRGENRDGFTTIG